MQALGANTAKRQILSRTQLNVTAAATREIFAAARTGLQENCFRAQDAAYCVHEFFDVVAAFDGEDACVTVVLQPQVYEGDEFFFFNPWQLEAFLV
jgi:hypothetical protein